jgi:hypothetical protein
MSFVKVLAVVAVSGFATGGHARAGAAGAAATPKEPAAAVVQPEARPVEIGEAPIVMGRSVGIARKSKLHHIKVKSEHPVASARN